MDEKEYWKGLFYKEHEAKKQAINDLTVTRREDLSKMKKELLRYQKALEEIESMTRNPREYEPLIYTLNHIARQGLNHEEKDGVKK